jgi:hypothetical protein
MCNSKVCAGEIDGSHRYYDFSAFYETIDDRVDLVSLLIVGVSVFDPLRRCKEICVQDQAYEACRDDP